MMNVNGNEFSIFRYTWGDKTDLISLLDSTPFLQFLEDLHNDLINFYNITNGLDGTVTPDALNTALAFGGAIRHELTLMYEALKELEERDSNDFEDFKAEKEIEVRKRENRSELATGKWLAQTEIAKYAKIENFELYKQYRDACNDSHKKMRLALKYLNNLNYRLEELKTISANARSEMSNINISQYSLKLEEQAREDIKARRLATEALNKRSEANNPTKRR